MCALQPETPERIQIRLNLDGDIAKKFIKIKKHYGFENNTDLLRYLIAEKHDQLAGGRT